MMNYKKILSAFAITSLLLSSCDDQIMEWYDDPSHGEVSRDELPLELKEKISRYEALKSYTDMTLGAGVGLTQYMDNESYRALTNENFDEVTVGYAMKHGPMVQSDGSIGFDAVDAFIAETQNAGLTVFGHTLVWHTNQNASYLNGLIAPTVIPGAGGSNALDVSGLEDGSFSGWNRANTGDGITVEEGKGLSDQSSAVQMIAGASAANPWNLQLITPDIPIVSGHNYEISFFIKSDQAGKGRLSFARLTNNYPWMDWFNTGGEWTEAFETSTAWQQVKVTVNDFSDVSFQIAFDMGYLPGVTYWIDVDNIKVVDLDAEPTINNWLANGDFEDGLIGWNRTNGNDPVLLSGVDAFEGDGAMQIVVDADNPGEQWRAQIQSKFPGGELVAGTDYTISLWVRSEAAGGFRISTTNEEAGNYSDVHYLQDETTSSTWQQYSYTITAAGYESGISLDFGAIAGSYSIDNIMVTDGEPGGGAGPTIIEKTDEEKTQIIGEAMENWIAGMVDHYKTSVRAWDVVNEPMRENGEVRDGDISDLADDEFYWQKYLGKDYAVTAFNLARQYGNATDVLFINDYNLESNMTKLDGLIAYVEYIEQQGAVVDGIGTQMHISHTSDKDMIAQMFQKLAATGKQIKISELDVRLGTANPTAEQLAAQADMYRYVIEAFKEYIPAAQQYGITIWGISDNPDEHEYWLPDESPNLWDANYERKHAYKGAADGLAGRDVSEDFSGDLQD